MGLLLSGDAFKAGSRAWWGLSITPSSCTLLASALQVRVENWSKSTVQLVSRHWVIEDAQGRECDSVPKGSPGVVGQQPLLRPGKRRAGQRGPC